MRNFHFWGQTILQINKLRFIKDINIENKKMIYIYLYHRLIIYF